MAKGGICVPSSALVPCAGSRRRAPLAGSGDLDERDQAERCRALGLTPTPGKSGILNKRGEALFRGWAERLVVLDDMALRYYDVSFKDTDKPPSKSARGLIPLSSKSQVRKLDGEHAPRARGAGLDWKGSVTDGNGMPFCFKIEAAGQEYVFQAASDNERSGWIQALHARIESLARLEPRAQHQHEIASAKKSFASSIMGALTPLSGRSSGRSTPGTEEEEDEISDLMMTDGLSQQLKLALKGQEREEERVRRAEIIKKAKEEARERGEEFVAASEEQAPGRSKKKHGKALSDKQPPPPKGMFASQVPAVPGGWCSAPNLAPSWLGLCDGKARQAGAAEGEDALLPPASGGKHAHHDPFKGQVTGNGGRTYQPSSIKKKNKGKLARHGEEAEGGDGGDQVPTTPGGRAYVEAPAFGKKSKPQAKPPGPGLAGQPIASSLPGGGVAAGKAHGTDKDRRGGTEMEALYDFVPEQTDEMPLSAGDRVLVHKEFEDGWCSARMLAPAARRGGRDRVTVVAEGMVPRAYLRPASPRHTAAPPRAHSDAECLPAESKGGHTKGSLPSALKGSREERQRQRARLLHNGTAPSPGPSAQDLFTLLPAKAQTSEDEADAGDAGPGMAGGKPASRQQGVDDPDCEPGAGHAPVLSLLRKKSMSWKAADQAASRQDAQTRQAASAERGAGGEMRRGVSVASPSLVSPPTPVLQSEEEMSASSEDEEERAAIAARKARQASPSKPPLAKKSPADERADTGDGNPTGKEKRKSLLSRNPRKMLNKILARSRSASREPSPRPRE